MPLSQGQDRQPPSPEGLLRQRTAHPCLYKNSYEPTFTGGIMRWSERCKERFRGFYL